MSQTTAGGGGGNGAYTLSVRVGVERRLMGPDAHLQCSQTFRLTLDVFHFVIHILNAVRGHTPGPRTL